MIEGMPVSSQMVALGTPAPDFALPSLDGKPVGLDDFAAAPALLVAFICNHCPYVKHIEMRFGVLIAELAASGLATVGICSNDVDAYPDDGPAGLRVQAERAGFGFPYLLDESQSVAVAYRAACTPDLFLYDADRSFGLARGSSTSRGRVWPAWPPARPCRPPSSTCWPGGRCCSSCTSPRPAAGSSGSRATPRPEVASRTVDNPMPPPVYLPRDPSRGCPSARPVVAVAVVGRRTNNHWGFHIPGTDILVNMYALFRTNLGVVQTMIAINSRRAQAVWEGDYWDFQAHVPMGPNFDLCDYSLESGLSVRATEPNRVYDVRFDDGEGTSIEFTFRALMDPFDIHDPAMDPLAGEAWGDAYNGHFDQTGVFTGELVLRGQRMPFECVSTWDHSWGIRPERHRSSLSWLHAHFSKTSAIHAMLSYDPRPTAPGR